MDWNWFFSSLAQSAAAIVAIFGGFIITKVMNNQSDFERKCSEVKDCIRLCLRLVHEGQTVNFQFIVGLARQRGLHAAEMRIFNDNPVQDAEHYYRTTLFSAFDDRQQIINDINNLIENFRLHPTAPIARSRSFSNATAATEFHTQERNAGESINKYILDVNSLSLSARTLAAEIKGDRYSRQLVATAIIGIIVLFYVGVIYPLSFMPMIPNQPLSLSVSAFWSTLFSLPGAIMSVISVIFTLMMLAFLAINLRLKFDQQEIRKLEDFSIPEAFSPYLARATKNSGVQNGPT